MLRSNPTLAGHVYVYRNGVLVLDQKNLVTTVGKQLNGDTLFGLVPVTSALSHIGIGSGTTAAAITQTALVTQLQNRMPFSSAATRSGNIVTAQASFAAGVSTGSIREAGLFNALTGGVMFSRIVFATAIPKTAEDVLRIVWTVETL